MLAMIAKPNYKNEIPLFSAIIHKDKKPEMTAEEIKQHVLKRLME